MERITLSLVSHTNVGKTTLARTLLRRDVGEVLDQAHVTEVAEAYPMIATDDAELVLWDTPGFGDSVRLLERLRRHDQPIVWFLQQAWDRLTDRPLWCGQQAVLNIQHDSDVVLYLVNAAEEPEEAGYVAPELELLGWIGRPVMLLLNQTGDAPPEAMAERLAAWRRHAERWDVVRDVVALDAFSRCWVQESLLLERVVPLLDEPRRPAMRGLVAAWNARNLEVFERAVEALARYLAIATTDRQELPSKRPSRAEKRRAMALLAERLEEATGELMTTLLALHGLEGAAATAIDRQIDAFTVAGEDLLNPEKGAVLGGLVSGALGGLTADVLAGGLTFGGGVVAGAILGALGGAGLARGYQLVKGDKLPEVSWSPPFLDRLAAQTLLRYLAVAHFGRGRGQFREDEASARWKSLVSATLRAREDEWTAAWKRVARQADVPNGVRRLRPLIDRATREVLVGGYPEATELLLDGKKQPLEAE